MNLRTDGRAGDDVSVAIPSFHTLALLPVVCGAVRLTAPGAEMIVVDTGSAGGSREWAASRPWIRLERIDGVGPGPEAHGAALDRALALARRPLLAVLDSDAVPLGPEWLEALSAALGERSACGTTKERGEVSVLRRLLWRLRGRRPGPEWSYLRPNRALYRTEALRRRGLSFRPAPGPPDGKPLAVGEALARSLAAAGEVALIPPERMSSLVVHLRHATMALNPAEFPRLGRRAARAARARIDRFLASDWARRCAASS